MLSDAHFLAVAHIVADAGTCSRLQVGAILVKDRRIISTGYNGAPAGTPHCYHQEGDKRPCEKAVHAEVNAIAFAAKSGVATSGSVLYTTDSPCAACARLIVNAGIKEVKYGKRFRDTAGLSVLSESGIRFEELGEPLLHLVRVVGGDGEGLYTSEHTDPAFEEGWGALADSRSRRSSGVFRGTNG